MTFLLAGGGGLLSFNPGFALWILVSMILFIAVMMKYAVPPIMTALTAREASIKDSLESAEKALARAEQVSKDNDKALRDAAKASIEQEKKRALLELRNEVAQLAIKSASIIIDAELDNNKNNKLVDNFINDLSNN